MFLLSGNARRSRAQPEPSIDAASIHDFCFVLFYVATTASRVRGTLTATDYTFAVAPGALTVSYTKTITGSVTPAGWGEW